MKSALVLEKDAASCARTSSVLNWLGYVTAPVRTPDEALNVVSTIKFDVIVTCTANRPHDRRSLTGELKRAVPDAAVVLIAENDDDYRGARAADYPGTSAVITRPASVDTMRRIVEFGIDGYGLQPASVPATHERRKKRA